MKDNEAFLEVAKVNFDEAESPVVCIVMAALMVALTYEEVLFKSLLVEIIGL